MSNSWIKNALTTLTLKHLDLCVFFLITCLSDKQLSRFGRYTLYWLLFQIIRFTSIFWVFLIFWKVTLDNKFHESFFVHAWGMPACYFNYIIWSILFLHSGMLTVLNSAWTGTELELWKVKCSAWSFRQSKSIMLKIFWHCFEAKQIRPHDDYVESENWNRVLWLDWFYSVVLK